MKCTCSNLVSGRSAIIYLLTAKHITHPVATIDDVQFRLMQLSCDYETQIRFMQLNLDDKIQK